MGTGAREVLSHALPASARASAELLLAAAAESNCDESCKSGALSLLSFVEMGDEDNEGDAGEEDIRGGVGVLRARRCAQWLRSASKSEGSFV